MKKSYEKALEILHSILFGDFDHENKYYVLEHDWPDEENDKFLEDICNNIIEYKPWMYRNEYYKKDAFYVGLLVAYHILKRDLNPETSYELYEYLLDGIGFFDDDSSTEESIIGALDKLIKERVDTDNNNI